MFFQNDSQEIEQRIRNSECTELYATNFEVFFNPGGEPYQWLLTNSKERFIYLEFFKDGVSLEKIEVSYKNKQSGYSQGRTGYAFGASGCEDLPNGAYVRAFKKYMVAYLQAHCPKVKVEDGAKVIIRLAPNAKLSW